MVATMHDTMLGIEIGRYRLTRLLGEGGMGRVYLAEQPAIGSRVAIKILSEECARSAELLERFFAEARAVNLIRHENIISVLDLALLPDGRPYIIMEYIEGQTLSAHVRKTTAPLGGVAQVMGEVLSGLAAAHALGIVHRDLKPDNVLVTVEGHAKVLDFGIAKLAPGLRADVSPRTKTGALLGTPAYMAPEQISGAGNVDARTDIYAAGVVLYEAVTGVVPFTGATLFDVMRAHLEDVPVPPSQRRPDLPPPLEHVILQALAKDPEHRFQSAQAMAQALAHAASTLPPNAWAPLSTRGVPRISGGGYGPPSTGRREAPLELATTAAAPPPTAARRRRRGIVIAAAASAIVATGVVLLAVSQRGGDDEPSPPPPAAPETVAVAPRVDAAPAPAAPPTPVPVAEDPPAPVRPKSPRVTPPDAAVPAPDATAPPAVNVGSNVSIGSNVQVGQGVTITTRVPSTQISQAADYSAKNFDPVAYLPKALLFARKLAPDARLTSFEFGPVYRDGRVDLTVKSEADNEYRFRSPAKSGGDAEDKPCMIYLELSPTTMTARVVTRDECKEPLVRHPVCRFASVWKQALALEKPPTDNVARIGWLFDQKWFFDTVTDGVETIEDKCP